MKFAPDIQILGIKDMLQIKFCKRLLWMWTKEGCKFNFLGNIFFTTSQSVWYQIFWAKLQDAMDIHGFHNNFFLLFFTVSNTSVQNFKKNISDWNKLLKSWKVSKFIISCLGIHEYPCHPEFWFQYSSVK